MHKPCRAVLLLVALLALMWALGGCGGHDGPAPAKKVSPASAPLEYTADAEGNVSVNVIFHQVPRAEEAAFMRDAGARVKLLFHFIPAANVKVPEARLEAVLGALRADPRVRLVEPDGIEHMSAQTVPWGITRIGAPTVHASGNKGAGVNVLIEDSGIDYTHPDLDANYYGGYDYINSDSDPMDDNGHGTHVSGTVAAEDNTIGVIGVAPQARLYAYKMFSASGTGTHAGFAAGLQWAVDNGMKVVNYSGGGSHSTTKQQACQAAYDAGILIAAASGNDNSSIGYPARYDTTLAVGATDSSDTRAWFSNYGPELDVVAPGVSVNSCTMGGGYASWQGTSMATPHVAGVATLVVAGGDLGADPTPAALMQRIRSTADDLGAPGFDDYYGHGIVDAVEAVGAGPTTGTIAGTVRDANTLAPIAGATVEADTGQTDQTNASGQYALNDVPAGGRQVTASASGYNPETATVQVTAGQTATQDFALTPSGGPPGTVWGWVRSATTGVSINGATVEADTGQTAHSNRGRYMLYNVPSGSRQITASATGYDPQTLTVQVAAGKFVRQDFSLTPSGGTTGSVAGTVTDADTGLPIAGATVATDTGQSDQTAANGSYTVNNVPAGQRQVTASATGYNPQTATVQVNAGQTANRDFALTPSGPTTGSVAGTVTDASTGLPIAGATVATDTGQSDQTAANGTYTINNVPPGQRQVTASATGYDPESATVQVNAGQTANQDFALTPSGGTTGTISGTVADAATGAPIYFALLRTDTGQMVWSDRNGAYTLGNVPAGARSVSVRAMRYSSQTATVQVIAGQTTQLDFALSRGW